MPFLYSFLISFYSALIKLAALFDAKARKWVVGRKHLFSYIEQQIDQSQSYVWFHAASLGEFEQGRPVMEEFRKQYPNYKIVLTFFSPSGYEIRKNFEGADHIWYLPADTRRNARKFLALVNPRMVFFIKYEFWFNYIRQIHKKNIPLYFFSVKFRPDQFFFAWYGGWFRKNLQKISWLFVQDTASLGLMESIKLEQCSLSGDTRFDRVRSVAIVKKDFPLVAKFSANARVLIAGSTWQPDEEFLIQFIKQQPLQMKFIVASHEIHEDRMASFQARIQAKSVRFSELNDQNATDADVLIIDNIGMLLHLYQYAQVAYIGGGFGKSIHNILEAATFGKPVVFGPAYHKFQEALDLIALGGAFPVNTYKEFDTIVQRLFAEEDFLHKTSNICSTFVVEHSGATDIIMDKIATQNLVLHTKRATDTF